MIKANAHKYSVSAMCRVLQVNRSTYYYEAATKKDESELTADIQEIFRKSRNHYGTRKIKKELADCGKQVSRRRIGRIMKQEGLISSYTTAQFKPQKDRCNESKVANVLNRQFQNQPYRNVVVSDLTYVRVGNHWNYICVLIDLFNREIVGYSAGEHKTAELVKQAFRKVEGNLSEIHIFHTDRGNEFKNETIEELLETFHIERSLSHKGCPYDNAVAEATFKVIKTEFVWNETFHTLEELKIKLWDYVNWYNHHRIHSSLGYQTPVQYRENNLKKLSEKVLTIQFLGVSRSGYLAWLHHVPSDTEKRREAVKAKIQDIYDDSKQNYGAPKITVELRKTGEVISERTVGTYMRQMGIRAQWSKPWTITTKDSDFSTELQNILDEQFNPDRPNAVWCSDITYIATICRQTNSNKCMEERTLRLSFWQVKMGRNFSF